MGSPTASLDLTLGQVQGHSYFEAISLSIVRPYVTIKHQ